LIGVVNMAISSVQGVGLGVGWHHGDERHTDVGEAAQHAVQRRLVDRAVEDRAAVGGVGEHEAVERSGPAGGQMSLDANPVVLVHRAYLRSRDCLKGRKRCGETASPHVVRAVVNSSYAMPGSRRAAASSAR
jgi:hypothetical protein